MESDQKMEKHYVSNEEATLDPITIILNKLEGIGRLEKKLDSASMRLTSELDLMRAELNSLNEGRKADNTALVGLEKSIKDLKEEVHANTETNKKLEEKISLMDNTANKTQNEWLVLRMKLDS